MKFLRSFFLNSSAVLWMGGVLSPDLAASNSIADQCVDDAKEKRAAAQKTYDNQIEIFESDLLSMVNNSQKTKNDFFDLLKTHNSINSTILVLLTHLAEKIRTEPKFFHNKHYVMGALLDRFYPEQDGPAGLKNLLDDIKDFFITPESNFLVDYDVAKFFRTKQYIFSNISENNLYDENMCQYLTDNILKKMKMSDVNAPGSYAHTGFLVLLCGQFHDVESRMNQGLAIFYDTLIEQCAELGIHPLFTMAHGEKLPLHYPAVVPIIDNDARYAYEEEIPEIVGFIRQFIFGTPDSPAAFYERPVTLTPAAQTFSKEIFQNPNLEKDNLAQEKEIIHKIKNLINDREIIVHDGYFFETDPDIIDKLQSRSQDFYKDHPVIFPYVNGPRHHAYTKMVQQIINQKDPQAINYYKLLSTGQGFIDIQDGEGKTVKRHFFAPLNYRKNAPYLTQLENYLNETHGAEIVYFKKAVEHPIISLDTVTAEQQERLILPDPALSTSLSLNGQNMMFQGGYTMMGDQLMVNGSFYSHHNGVVIVNGPVNAGGDITLFTLGQNGVLDAADNILIVAEEFNIHRDAKICAGKSVEFIQLPQSDGFLDLKKSMEKDDTIQFIKSRYTPENLPHPDVDLDKIQHIESEIFSYTGIKNDAIMDGQHPPVGQFPFVIGLLAYNGLKDLLWNFPPQKRDEIDLFYSKVQQYVDDGSIVFDDEYTYTYPPSSPPIVDDVASWIQ